MWGEKGEEGEEKRVLAVIIKIMTKNLDEVKGEGGEIWVS